jgi:hypothetical protein
MFTDLGLCIEQIPLTVNGRWGAWPVYPAVHSKLRESVMLMLWDMKVSILCALHMYTY